MKKLFAVLRYLILFGVGIVLLYFAFRGQDFNELVNKLRSANFFWIGVSLTAGFIAYISRAIRWKMLLEPLGYKPSTSNTFIALMVGYIANLALPRLGEVLRCTLLNRLEKVPVEVCLGTVVAERVFDLIMLMLALCLTLLLQFDKISGFLFGLFSNKVNTTQEPTSSGIYWALAAVALAGLLLLLLLVKYQHYLHRYTMYTKAHSFVQGLGKSMISVRNLRSPGLFILHTLIIWVMYFTLTYTAFFALPETANLGWQVGLVIFVVGGLGMTAPVQGGIGAFHWIVKKTFMLYGVSEADGLSMATILHGSQTLLVIVVGGICLLMSVPRIRTTREATAAATSANE